MFGDLDGCEWMSVSSGQPKAIKRLCVCVCVRVCLCVCVLCEVCVYCLSVLDIRCVFGLFADLF